MANEEHLQRLQQGVSVWNTWREDHPETRLNVSGIMLDLRSADLHERNLMGADLSDADLRNVTLILARLRDADLRRARLVGADLRETIFMEATLKKADLSKTNMRGANLTGADLKDILYDRSTTWPNGFRPPPSR